MRHPAAPTIIVALLGFLVALLVWNTFWDAGHHEGNPHPDDMPKRAVKEGDAREEGIADAVDDEEKEEEL
ncbi:hypothetical protein GQ43DRAFT_383303 [Delitschia confertaspora ATCC 74209]|uniref:Uncharacterized protein n=1 Tax=Delitschia confertaspora ATCC 74209 TaxID=1513339 RepID=A0A9P4JC48_9PLEO|nr:hypothetical protein GQ43DRAFT_383303 [Delitschia confertaspora ATCC 74209]